MSEYGSDSPATHQKGRLLRNWRLFAKTLLQQLRSLATAHLNFEKSLLEALRKYSPSICVGIPFCGRSDIRGEGRKAVGTKDERECMERSTYDKRDQSSKTDAFL
jgi:hypothetical protein